MNVVWRNLRVAVGACLLGLVLAASGGAATSSLPGGTSIEVTIGSPADGSGLPQGPVTISGTAAVGKAAPIANTTLIYIVDVSGSTSQQTATTTPCAPQTAYSAVPNTTLDCELLAVRDMNDAAISTGTVAKVGLIGFGGSVPGNPGDAQALDLSSATDAQPLVAPDASGSTTPTAIPPWLPTATNDLDWVLQSAYAYLYTPVFGWPTPAEPYRSGFALFTPWDTNQETNYWAAINALKGLLPSVTTPNVLAVFLSDGNSNTGSPSGNPVSTALTDLEASLPSGMNLKIDTYAIGGAAQCSPTTTNMGTLLEIAQATGGTCQHITDPGQTAATVPAAIASQLSSISLSLDSGTGSPPDTVSQTLPATGPVGPVDFSSTYASLSPGQHEVCATASGSDGGGDGDVTDCVSFWVDPLDALISLTNNLPPGKSLPAKAANVKADYEAGNTTAACNLLAAFVSEVQAQSGKQLTTAQANQLLAAATAAGTFLGC